MECEYTPYDHVTLNTCTLMCMHVLLMPVDHLAGLRHQSVVRGWQ